MKLVQLASFLVILFTLVVGCEFKQPGFQPASESSQQNTSTLIQSGRDTWQKPELVIRALGVITDKTIMDIGAGTGYFTFRFAFDAEKVIAAEIDEQMIELIELFRENLPAGIKDKIETRLVGENDPMMEENEVDIVVIINTIGYINRPTEYLGIVKEDLKENGQIMIVDFKKEYLPIDAPDMEDRIYGDSIVAYLEKSGYSNVQYDNETLDFQYIIIANK